MGIRSIIAGVSSHSSLSEDTQEFIEAGLDDYQEKPLTPDKLVAILHKVNLHVWISWISIKKQNRRVRLSM